MNKKCSICWLEKDISEFYSQKWWVLWVKWECKQCYLLKRRTEKYRKLDRDRYYNNKKRKEYIVNHSIEWKNKFPEKRKAQLAVWNYFRWVRKLERPNKCCVCWSVWKIHLHHEDYNKPSKVFPLCNICHANRHSWNLELDFSKELELDLSDKRKNK